MRVKIISGVVVNKEAKAIGEVLDLPDWLAQELIQLQKAEVVAEGVEKQEEKVAEEIIKKHKKGGEK